MQAAILGLDGFVQAHRKLVLAAWTAVFLLAAPFSLMQSRHLTGGGYDVRGTDSYVADHALQSDFRGGGSEAVAIVLQRAGGTPADLTRAIQTAAARARTVRRVRISPAAIRAARSQAQRANAVVLPLDVSGSPDQAIDVATKLRKRIGSGGPPRAGVRPYVVGAPSLWSALHDLQTTDLKKAEQIGFPITLILLLATFGSVFAAILPGVLGAITVTLTGGIVYLLSLALPMSIFVSSAASMIGIGVAIDYSLFVLARYRQEVAAGRDPDDARRTALSTAGCAVAFSGITVAIAVASLFLFDATVLRSMAAGVIIAVALCVLATVGLLPALLSTLGRRAYMPGTIGRIKERMGRRLRRRSRGDFWTRWTERVMRRPLASLLLAAAVMVTLAVPLTSAKFNELAAVQFPRGHEAVLGTRIAAAIVGPGALSPLDAVIKLDRPGPAARRALGSYARAVRRDPEVAFITPPTFSRTGTEAVMQVVPRHFGEDPPGRALLTRLRNGARTSAIASVGSVSFGGDVPLVQDFKNHVTSRLPIVVGLLIALTLILMLVVMRSVVLPIKAVIMNLLTLGAASGVTVAIFQWGWLDGPLGYHHPGYVDVIVLPLMVAVVFGLSMDYELFMLTRIREAWLRTGSNSDAVAEGLRTTAAPISSAALIMVSVFLSFAAVSVPGIKEIGTALAVAIALDVTLVRLVLVPATMRLLGQWNWWLPRPLEIVPHLAFEPPAHEATSRLADGGAARPVPAGRRFVGVNDHDPAQQADAAATAAPAERSR